MTRHIFTIPISYRFLTIKMTYWHDKCSCPNISCLGKLLWHDMTRHIFPIQTWYSLLTKGTTYWHGKTYTSNTYIIPLSYHENDTLTWQVQYSRVPICLFRVEFYDMTWQDIYFQYQLSNHENDILTWQVQYPIYLYHTAF